MGKEDIYRFLGDDWTSVLGFLHDSLKTDIKLLQDINDDILAHSGKMLRPALGILVAGACCKGPVNEDAKRYAASAEILHNATLLHDDVVDESDTRRGEKTLRSKMGSGPAVLVGDYWLAASTKLLLDSGHMAQVMHIYAKTISDLSEGEMLQLQKAILSDTTMEDYLRIIYCKTASLFETVCVGCALAMDASEDLVEGARKYARALGTAFQVKDDILDYVGGEALGKPVGLDLMEKKITMPLLCAMSGSEREAEIRGMVSRIDITPENCTLIREFVSGQQGVEKAASALEGYVAEAISALDVFPDSGYKTMLIEIAKFNSIRNS